MLLLVLETICALLHFIKFPTERKQKGGARIEIPGLKGWKSGHSLKLGIDWTILYFQDERN